MGFRLVSKKNFQNLSTFNQVNHARTFPTLREKALVNFFSFWIPSKGHLPHRSPSFFGGEDTGASAMAGSQPRQALSALMLLGLMQSAAAVEVCKVVDLQLVTQTGEFFLAVTFLGLGVSTVIFVLMAFKAAHEKRKFYFVTCYIGAVSTFAYYAMLSGQGWLITPSCRQLFYVR